MESVGALPVGGPQPPSPKPSLLPGPADDGSLCCWNEACHGAQAQGHQVEPLRAGINLTSGPGACFLRDTAQEDLGWGRSFLGSRDGSGHMPSPKPERRWMSDEVFRGQRPPMSQATGQGDHSLHALSMPGLWRDVGAELSDIPQFQGACQNTWLPHRLNFFLCLSRSLLCILRAPGFIRGRDRVIGSQLEYTHFCLCQIY